MDTIYLVLKDGRRLVLADTNEEDYKIEVRKRNGNTSICGRGSRVRN